ncbi:hypothetical protein RI367_002669 [Sorochytrium milnesiophthora]
MGKASDVDSRSCGNDSVPQTPRRAIDSPLRAISPSSFYATPSRKKPTTSVSRRSNRMLNVTPRTLVRYLPPGDRLGAWFVFGKQAKAFASASVIANGSVFSYESDPARPGKRSYIATSPAHFWREYNKLTQWFRHHYEVIMEGKPCKLYFDLEFLVDLNPTSKGDAMTQTLKEFVCQQFRSRYKISCSPGNFVDLSSDTDKKFSRHLICNISRAYFKDNAHVGAFVEEIVCAIDAEIRRDGPLAEQLRALYVNTSDKDSAGKRALFIDRGVYTKNRNMRLLLSSKMGKGVPLVFAADNTHPVTDPIEYKTFKASLIGYHDLFRPGDRVLTSFGLIAPLVASMSLKPSRAVEGPTTTGAASNSKPPKTGRGSAFPALDQYITANVVHDNTAQGYIRSVLTYAEDRTLVYAIGGPYRFCHHVQRHHKSNGIYIVVDLDRRTYVQKCYDPDCRTYRSPEQSIPADVLPPPPPPAAAAAHSDEEDMWAGIGDDEVLAIALQFEEQQQQQQQQQKADEEEAEEADNDEEEETS